MKKEEITIFHRSTKQNGDVGNRNEGPRRGGGGRGTGGILLSEKTAKAPSAKALEGETQMNTNTKRSKLRSLSEGDKTRRKGG